MGVGGIAVHGILANVRALGIEEEIRWHTGDPMAMQLALTIPEGLESYLPAEPNNRREAVASLEWQQRKGVEETEMGSLIKNEMWDRVKRSDNEVVVRTKIT